MQRAARFLALALAVVAVWYGRRIFQHEPPPPAGEREEPARYALADVKWTRLDAAGQPEFRVTAHSIQYYADERVQMRELTLDALGGPRGAWHVEAAAGSAPPRERRLLLTGGVVAAGTLQGAGPMEFRTDRLWVDQLRRELHTEQPVALEGPGRQASAVGLRTDFNGERLELLREVQVHYAPAP